MEAFLIYITKIRAPVFYSGWQCVSVGVTPNGRVSG